MRLYEGRPSGTIDRARELRKHAPEPERRLLRALREAFPHLKRRHQAPVGACYADILCFSKKLVRVHRFSNAEVTQEFDGVLTAISFFPREKEGTRKGEDDRTIRKGALV